MPREKPAKISREESRRARRIAGEQGGSIARRLMELKEAELKNLALDEDLQWEVEQSRRIKSMNARRREERRLAGVLRTYDLEDLAARLDDQHQAGQGDVRRFKLAESWRDRLIDDPDALTTFLEENPELEPKKWHRLVVDARRQRQTGKPKGAGKLLFREVIAVLT